MNEKNMPLLEHLGELRKVLIVSLLSIVVTSIVSFVFVEKVINFLVQPLSSLHVKLTFISITEAFMTQIKVAIFLGVILALPVIMYQFWNFILPGLRKSERKYLSILVPLSIILFLIGLAFAYFTVFRFGLTFLIQAGEGIGAEAKPTMNSYFSFLIAFLLPFGAIFEIPLVVYVLAKLGIVSHTFLAKNRKYAILINFIAAGVLTPGTDVVSQLFMAVPMLILYEISIFVAKVVKPNKVETDFIETSSEEVTNNELVNETAKESGEELIEAKGETSEK